MVKKLFGFLYKGFLDQGTGSLNQAALLLGLFTFLSQILAFLRDRLLAHIFGAGPELDIYYAAFRVPDFIFVAVASVVSISVLVPFIIEKDIQGREELQEFLDSVFSFFIIIIGVSAACAYFFMPQITQALFGSLPESSVQEIISLSRILLLSPIFLGLSNFFGSLTQAYNRFALYALAPLLYNAGIIVGIILLGERIGVIGVVIGVIIGATLHALVQLPFIFKARLLPRPFKHTNLTLVKKVVRISLPRTLTLSMSSLALVFLAALASKMVDGSISIFSFSLNIQSVPLSLVGISYSLAAFPILSRRFQEKNLGDFVDQMQATTRFIIFWSLPITALLIVLRAQVVRVLLGTGLFDWPATRLTAAALAIFVISSMFQSLTLLFMRGFYSAGFTKRPFFINLFSTILLVSSTYWFINLFETSETFHYFIASLMKVEDLSGSVLLMLPLGFSISTIVNGLLLWFFFEREFKGFSRGVVKSLFQGIGTAVLMGTAAYVNLNLFDTFFDVNTLPGIFLQGLVSGLIAIVVGIFVFIALKSPELSQVWSVLRGRFWKVKVIAADPEIV